MNVFYKRCLSLFLFITVLIIPIHVDADTDETLNGTQSTNGCTYSSNQCGRFNIAFNSSGNAFPSYSTNSVPFAIENNLDSNLFNNNNCPTIYTRRYDNNGVSTCKFSTTSFDKGNIAISCPAGFQIRSKSGGGECASVYEPTRTDLTDTSYQLVCNDGDCYESGKCYHYYSVTTKSPVYYPSCSVQVFGDQNDANGSAKVDYDNLCTNNAGVRKALRIVSIILTMAKWIVPLIVIILGMVDYFKAVVSTDEHAINKATKTLIRRFIIGIAVFLIPTILLFGLEAADSYEAFKNSKFNACVECLLDPNKC